MIKAVTKPVKHISAPPLVPSEPVIDFTHLGRMTLGEKNSKPRCSHCSIARRTCCSRA